MSTDVTFNCNDGSSRATCVTAFGCNEQSTSALCCAPSPLCGNGVVDAPEEQCDDANFDETDDCLNSCSWRLPSAHAVAGC
jgi:cysteine-rich repeat protein